MFYYKYNIFNDGDFVIGFNDLTEAKTAYADILSDYLDADANLFDHEWQMLELIAGPK